MREGDQAGSMLAGRRGGEFIGSIVHDVMFGFRMFRKSPGFTAITVFTLAIGIGASTAVFSVVNGVLLRSLPFPEPDKIMMIWRLAPIGSNFGGDDMPWRKKDFRLFLSATKTFQQLGGFLGDSFNLTGSGAPERLDGIRASSSFFSALGVKPALGRAYTTDEDQPGHEFEVILSCRLWRERFAGEIDILGRTIELNGYPYTVIGIMPDDFHFPLGYEMPAVMDLPRVPQLWVPLALPSAPRGPNELAVIGRLGPNATVRQAEAELALFRQWEENQFPEGKGWYQSRVEPMSQQVTGDARRPLLLMLAATALVMLIASCNVANLLLSRSLSREGEFILRGALGAGRGRIVRQLMTEALLLSGVAAGVGIGLAWAAIYFVKTFGPANVPRLGEVSLDLRVMMFSLATALVTGILFGLAPIVPAGRRDLAVPLREGTLRIAGHRGSESLRRLLLCSEVALSLVLVVSATLLVRTLQAMAHSSLGFNPDHVLTFQLPLPSSKYKDTDRMAQVDHRVLEQLRSMPGVEGVGLSSVVPFGGSPDGTLIRIPDHPSTSDKEQPFANYSFVSPGYFSAIGVPVLRGRDVEDADIQRTQLVTVINRAMARKFWPGEDPLGKQVGVADLKWKTRTIVGIVGDIKHASTREDPAPEMFVPYTQNEIRIWPAMQTLQFAVHTRSSPQSLSESIRQAVASVDPDLPVAQIATLSDLVGLSMVQPRFSTLLIGSFAVVALLLAAVGVYGVISCSVSLRTREIGIRMALGAKRSAVLLMILRQATRLILAGVATGLLAAFAVTRFISRFLYGVAPTDTLTYSFAPVLLIAAGLLACCVPALEATRIDPLIALRNH